MSASSGGRAYQPNLGQFVSPVAAGMSGGAPYSYGGGDPVNDDPLEGVDEDGRPLPYQSVRSGLHHGAGQAAALLNTLADFNPLCQTFAIVTGRDAAGHKLRPGERLVRLLSMALPYAHIGGVNFLRGRHLPTGEPFRNPWDLHHIFPQQFRDWFSARGIDIHQYTVAVTQNTHHAGIHGRGGLPFPNRSQGILPGRYNARWEAFIRDNPDATMQEAYHFAGQLMEEFGLVRLPIVPFR